MSQNNLLDSQEGQVPLTESRQFDQVLLGLPDSVMTGTPSHPTVPQSDLPPFEEVLEDLIQAEPPTLEALTQQISEVSCPLSTEILRNLESLISGTEPRNTKLFEVLSNHSPGYTPPTGKVPSNSTNLIRKSGYYIIPFLGRFYYFKITPIVRRNSSLFDFGMKLPPYKREGLVVIDKEIYHVTLEDLQRRVVRVARKLDVKKGTITYDDFLNGTYKPTPKPIRVRNNTRASAGPGTGKHSIPTPSLDHFISGGVIDLEPDITSSQEDKVASLIRESTDDIDLQHFGDVSSSGLEELEAADLYLQEQIRTLLCPVSEEEGFGSWEVTQAP